MPVVGLLSAKGSPGVTTTAVGLAAVEAAASGRAVWVELDPSGGTGWVQCRQSCPRTRPTLGNLTRVLREGPVRGDWVRFATEAPPAVPAVLSPPGWRAASALIGEGRGRWGEAFAAADGLVVVDAGRWDPEQPAAGRISGADVVGLVCRSTLESVEHARTLVAEVHAAAGCPVAAVVVGSRPFAPAEVAHGLGLPLGGVLDWRRGDIAALWAKGAARPGVRSVFGQSVTSLLGGLLSMVLGAPVLRDTAWPEGGVASIADRRGGRRP